MTTIVTRTGMWTTTEMMAALLERVMDDLYARGIRALYSHCEECDFLFSRDASTTSCVVAMAVRFYAKFGAVKAFTRGALCLSDNFDTVTGRFVAVENLTFGGAKTYLEHYEAHAFISDHIRWPDARVLRALSIFAKFTDRIATLEAAMEVHPEYRALYDAPNSTLARKRFLDALACRHVADVHAAVLDLGRKLAIGREDPVFAAAEDGEEALRELAASGRATVSDYFGVRLSLLDHVVHANPRFAKLAFGRGAMRALIQDGWKELCEWAVFFARRLQLARHPDLAFTFLMLNRDGALHCETSEHDDDWAVKLEVLKGMESPLDPLLYCDGEEEAENVWDRVRASTERPRRLGRVNALVARSLLQGPDGPSLEGASALLATGWVAWVDRCLPGEGSLLSPPRLPFEAEALPELRTWIEALRDGLVDRKAAGQLQRTHSLS